MTLALYCELGACSKCTGRNCDCVCHGGSTAAGEMRPAAARPIQPPPAPPKEPNPMQELNCRHCGRTCASGQGRAAHERHCPKRPDADTTGGLPPATCELCGETYEFGRRGDHLRDCPQIAAPDVTSAPKISAPKSHPPSPPVATGNDTGGGPPTVTCTVTVTVTGSPAQCERALRLLRP